MMIHPFDDLALRGLAGALSGFLTHGEISELFKSLNIQAGGEGSKYNRMYDTFKSIQRQDRCGNNVLAFVRMVLSPKRYGEEKLFEDIRGRVNEVLSYEGFAVNERGELILVKKARTISEVKERSSKLKKRVQGVTIHPDILPFCEEEWLAENYFHAILEIAKSVASKMQDKSGLTLDGSELVDACFGLGKEKKPILAFNMLRDRTEESEHTGFSSFIKGFFSMYRNPKAHVPRVTEETQLSAMIEVLVVATIIHNRLDRTHKTGY